MHGCKRLARHQSPLDAIERSDRHSDRRNTKQHDHMRGLPEPGLSVVRGLQAERPFVPVGSWTKRMFSILKSACRCFHSFDQASALRELLPQFGDFNRIGRRKENSVSHRLTQHHAISLLRIVHRGGVALGISFSDAVRA